MQILKMGSRGSDVARYQQILGVKADGIFGKITEQYVRGFQREKGLAQDGIIGPATAAALNSMHQIVHTDAPSSSISTVQLSERSKERLRGVHSDLIKVVEQAVTISPFEIMVIEGLRTHAQQKKYVASGASKTMNSRHLTGHAVDLGILINGQLTWDWMYYHQLGNIMKQAAKSVGVAIEWGGDWKTFKDGPHFQLPHGYK